MEGLNDEQLKFVSDNFGAGIKDTEFVEKVKATLANRVIPPGDDTSPEALQEYSTKVAPKEYKVNLDGLSPELRDIYTGAARTSGMTNRQLNAFVNHLAVKETEIKSQQQKAREPRISNAAKLYAEKFGDSKDEALRIMKANIIGLVETDADASLMANVLETNPKLGLFLMEAINMASVDNNIMPGNSTFGSLNNRRHNFMNDGKVPRKF